MQMDWQKPAKKLTTMALVQKLRPSQWRPGAISGFLPQRTKFSFGEGANLGLPDVLGRVGSLEVRLARTVKEVRRAQRLRYKVFYEEMSALPNATALISRRDVDEFDAICDHLLVLDHAPPRNPFKKNKPKVVGTYRLLRQDVADRHAGFYSASEFEVDAIIAAHPGRRFLELGRSCVLKSYRNKRTIELLFHGLWQYIAYHRIDTLVGCASLDGTRIDTLKTPLAFLRHFASTPTPFSAKAVPDRYISMDLLPREAIDTKRALHMLPPLVKAYLRLGATFGDGAVVDYQFGTTDVFVVLHVEDIDARYINHYGSVGAQAA